MTSTKKSLGQHWLADNATLDYITHAADLKDGETVLEIGPGTGNLTKKLLETNAKIVAIEKDESLARQLASQDNLKLITGDILNFNLTALPDGYKVVANIPYYLTSRLVRVLAESTNPPSRMVLLVQKEVAERLCAGPGQMSLLSVSAQLYYDCHLGEVVPAELFEPPPKVDSQVVILNRRSDQLLSEPDRAKFFRTVKAGFSERRKKLRSSLAGGLGKDKQQVDQLLEEADIDGNRRAQELSLKDWQKLAKKF